MDQTKMKMLFDNGKKYSPKDIVNIMLKLRKTGSMTEVGHVLKDEYKFTNDDITRFRLLLMGLALNWDELDRMGDKDESKKRD
jgi:hypothetical protein